MNKNFYKINSAFLFRGKYSPHKISCIKINEPIFLGHHKSENTLSTFIAGEIKVPNHELPKHKIPKHKVKAYTINNHKYVKKTSYYYNIPKYNSIIDIYGQNDYEFLLEAYIHSKVRGEEVYVCVEKITKYFDEVNGNLKKDKSAPIQGTKCIFAVHHMYLNENEPIALDYAILSHKERLQNLKIDNVLFLIKNYQNMISKNIFDLDIKPDNILINNNSEMLFFDFDGCVMFQNEIFYKKVKDSKGGLIHTAKYTNYALFQTLSEVFEDRSQYSNKIIVFLLFINSLYTFLTTIFTLLTYEIGGKHWRILFTNIRILLTDIAKALPHGIDKSMSEKNSDDYSKRAIMSNKYINENIFYIHTDEFSKNIKRISGNLNLLAQNKPITSKNETIALNKLISHKVIAYIGAVDEKLFHIIHDKKSQSISKVSEPSQIENTPSSIRGKISSEYNNKSKSIIKVSEAKQIENTPSIIPVKTLPENNNNSQKIKNISEPNQIENTSSINEVVTIRVSNQGYNIYSMKSGGSSNGHNETREFNDVIRDFMTRVSKRSRPLTRIQFIG